jgi:hypothetical protein
MYYKIQKKKCNTNLFQVYFNFNAFVKKYVCEKKDV